MATEQFTNGAQTTLTAAVAAGTGTQTISVFGTTGFPGSGNFRIRIDSELLLVTAVSGTTWTVDRAQEGTTGAAHSSGAAVTQVLTAGALQTLGGGAGTVTSVSVAAANGVSGTVANPTTTPAITLALGAITPTSVNGVALSGSATPALAVAGAASVSGSNTGDQTSVTGNAGTATALQTARNINGVSFNGTADVTVPAAAGTLTGTALNAAVTGSSLTSVGTLTGGATGSGFTVALSTATVTGTLAVARGGTGLGTAPTNGQLLIGNGTGYTLATLTAGTGISVTSGTGSITIAATGGTGTVTSVGLALPAVFSVSGSPVTSSGTLTAALATQSANTVWAGPATGAAAAPTFRALVADDLPAAVTGSVVPAGALLAFARTSAPAGWLVCDGSAVSRSTYAGLYAALGGAGSPWGQGDGSTTFNLPDFRRRIAVGSGGTGTGTLGNAVGNTGGAETHTLTTAEMPSHTHQTRTRTDANFSYGGGPSTVDSGVNYTNLGDTTGVGSAGGGGAHNNIQPSAVVLMCIKT